MTEALRASLYCRTGGSNKEYHLQLEPKGDGFVVNTQYGAIGKALTSGTRTPVPVCYEKALKEYAKKLKEQLGKGYTPSESGVAYQDTAMEAQFTGVLPQLLTRIALNELDELMRDPAWFMQQKADGERRMLSAKAGSETLGINKKGLRVPLPAPLAEAAARLAERLGVGFTIDGEIVGEKLYAFDLLELDGEDHRHRSAEDRYLTLLGLMQVLPPEDKHLMEVLEADFDEKGKRARFDKLKAANLEGVVFKRAAAPYTPGRPNSGGDQVKFKFEDPASVLVEGVNATRRSVAVVGFDDAGAKVPLGNVTIPPNAIVPAAGSVIEVRYLYAYKGGSLFQPVFVRARVDQDETDCLISQLKYQPEDQQLSAHEEQQSKRAAAMRP